MIEVSPQGYLQQIDPSVYERNCLVEYEFDRKCPAFVFMTLRFQLENFLADMEHLAERVMEARIQPCRTQ